MGFEPTYEELKPMSQSLYSYVALSFEPTYEELKPDGLMNTPLENIEVLSLPMRN